MAEKPIDVLLEEIRILLGPTHQGTMILTTDGKSWHAAPGGPQSFDGLDLGGLREQIEELRVYAVNELRAYIKAGQPIFKSNIAGAPDRSEALNLLKEEGDLCGGSSV